MRCNSCQKEIAESGVAYGINPDALCKCPRGAGDMNAAAKEIKISDTLIKALKDAAAKKTNPDEILAQRRLMIAVCDELISKYFPEPSVPVSELKKLERHNFIDDGEIFVMIDRAQFKEEK